MSKALLLEVGTEEIPARFLPKALEELKEILGEKLAAAGITPGSIRVFGTPRRMAVLAEDLPEHQPKSSALVLGPSRQAAFDGDGNPTRAALGFAKKHGVDVSALVTEQTEKGTYVATRKMLGGIATKDLLARLLPETILAIPFPKSMRWGEGELRFARPIHWIVALFGREVIPFTLGGIESDNHSRGHSFIHPGSVRIGSPEDYVDVLSKHNVIVSPADRRARIESEVHAWAATVDGEPVRDPDLLELVTFLVELPTTVRGEFDSSYLELPREVLINSMREHQRYFSVQDEQGNLKPYFVSVLNISPKDHAIVIRGNERVLRARLADARFFFDEDRKVSLESRIDALKDVLFHAKIGTIHDKVQRLEKLAGLLGENVGESDATCKAAKRAARLCKADLLTHMVGEFPDLQGVMGRAYARLEGEAAEVSEAIEEHYRPRFAGGPLPASAAGALLAIADKLDTLAGCFKANLLPTATQDPYALRRAALGIIAILQDRPGWRLPFDWAVRQAFVLNGAPEKSEVPELLLEFFRGRLQHHLTAAGHSPDVVEAVLSARLEKKRTDYVPGTKGLFSWDIAGISLRVEVLSEGKKRDDFLPLATTFKRVVNIIPTESPGPPVLDLEDLTEPAEVRLVDAFNEVHNRSRELIVSREYEKLFAELRKLKAPVDRFFDQVRVLDSDKPQLMAQRIALLRRIADLFYEIADFSRIMVEQDVRS